MYDETHTSHATQSLPVVIVVNRHRRHLYYSSETAEPAIDHYHLTPYSFQHLLALLTRTIDDHVVIFTVFSISCVEFGFVSRNYNHATRRVLNVNLIFVFCLVSNEANHTTAAVASLIFPCESTPTSKTISIYLRGH
jgi:hypothetical protein